LALAFFPLVGITPQATHYIAIGNRRHAVKIGKIAGEGAPAIVLQASDAGLPQK